MAKKKLKKKPFTEKNNYKDKNISADPKIT